MTRSSGFGLACLGWLLLTTATAAAATAATATAGPVPEASGTTKAPTPAPSYSLSPGPQGRERLLVGVLLEGREIGALEVLRGEEFYLPLEPFVELLGIGLLQEGEEVRLETPLGVVNIDAEDFVVLEGQRYLTQTAIENKLATRLQFDAEAFALMIDLAWRRRATEGRGRVSDLPTPDVEPPSVSLSTIRIDSQYLDSSGSQSLSSNTLLSGRVAGGRWQIRWQDDFAGSQRVQDYAWTRTRGRQLWLAGHQRVQLHPLLPGFELTGVQQAWTNQPLELYPHRQQPGELLPRRLRPTQTFEGRGPPAGVAELRIEGRVLARRTLGLDGRYAFYDVPLPNHQLNRVEIYVYDRHNLGVPVEIHDRSRHASEVLLPADAQIHQGGLGLAGNLAQSYLDGRDSDELAGFYQGRYGLSENFTVEAAIQGSEEQQQVMAGFVARLHKNFVLSFGAGSTGDAQGYNLALDGQVAAWRFRGFSQLNEAGFQLQGQEETFDHLLEIGYSRSLKLDLALLARSRQQGGQRADYVLPAFTWRPLPSFSLRARPDEKGDYVADLSYGINRKTRFGAHHQDDRTFLDLSYQLPRNFNLFVGQQFGGNLEERTSAAVRWAGSGRLRPTWTAGAIYSQGDLGYRVAATAAVLPGVLLRVDWTDDPLPFDTAGNRNEQLIVGLTTDLAWNRGRLHAAQSLSLGRHRGGVAGRVRVEAPSELRDFPLNDLRVRIDGRPLGRTQQGGSFFIGNLRPGVYRLELDNENLPIELTAERLSVFAGVASGAVTEVEFVVRPEFGIAGRIRDAVGNPLPGVRVELLRDGENEGGDEILQTAVSDRFGLYRMDGVAIGDYTVRLAPESFPGASFALPSRSIKIRDEFLFGQDLALPAGS